VIADRRGYRSWGGVAAGPGDVVRPPSCEAAEIPVGGWLAWGNGRSYGDSCLPSDGAALIDMSGLDRILAFDVASGVVRAEAGLTLGALIDAVAPWGWFPQVLPGTRHVTLGGAVANDIHGKNHHVAGAFGEHVAALGILRSDRGAVICSPRDDGDLFRATIGGLGLTGLILWVEVRLMRVASPDVMQEASPIRDLGDFFTLSAQDSASHPYSVAWIDSLAAGSALGRGALLRGFHADTPRPMRRGAGPRIAVPFTPPVSLINRWSLRAFNAAYRGRTLSRSGPARTPFGKFFFPLDALGSWNRLYGPNGLRQHQSVIPVARAETAFAAMLEETHRARQGSFLTVLKVFGDRPAAGIMSFPMAGATLTLDFPHRGPATDALLERLDRIAIEAGGRVNPYKDARMSPDAFAASFPQAAQFVQFIDPTARSRFAARVGLGGAPASSAARRVAAMAA